MDAAFESVLKRYNYKYEKQDNRTLISKRKGQNSSVSAFFLFSLFLVVAGIISILIFSIWLGIILLFSAIPLFTKSIGFSNQATKESSSLIEFLSDKILVYKKNGQFDLKFEDIGELYFHIDKDEDISVGAVDVLMKDKNTYNIIKVFGSDHRYIEDDVEIIADRMTKIING